MKLETYRRLLAHAQTRRFLAGLGVSALGDGLSAIVLLSTPLGTAFGDPLVASLGATGSLAASGVATIGLAIAASVLWNDRQPVRNREAPDTEPRLA